mgnify:CR=1 FL=1
MHKIKQELADHLSETLDEKVTEQDLEIPNGDYGDFAYPVMKIAGNKGENPRELAEKTAKEIEEINIVEKVEVAGPGYLNFFLDRENYSKEIEKALTSEKMGVKEKEGSVLVEFSSPNLAKPMHIGHLRNNVLGDSLQRIFSFVGYDVTSENYIGDWGTKHGQVIYAFKKWGSMEEFEKNPMSHMYDLYVRLHDEGTEEEHRKAREWSKKIEEGDEEARELWNMFRKATIEHNEKEYERMDIEFDRVTGESVVAEEAEEIIEEGLEKNIFQEDEDGSVFVEFEEDEFPSTIVKRTDGSTLYLSRDIANIRKREREGFDQNLYVVATEQNLHFQQLFNIAEEFGITDIESEHISYGMLHLESGSMSSSKGNIIRLNDVIDRAAEKAADTEERDVGNAEAVGLGALKYANLSISREKDIEFSWDRALSFEGNSGPYLQYSNTRAKSILRKAENRGKLTGKLDDQEYQMMKKMAEFPEKVEKAAKHREPAKIANYLSELCEIFNSFYHSSPVLDADAETKNRRLRITELFVEVTDQGLELLGIEPLEEM